MNSELYNFSKRQANYIEGELASIEGELSVSKCVA